MVAEASYLLALEPFMRALFFVVLLVLGASALRSDPQQRTADELVFSSGVSGLFDTENNPTFVLEYRPAREWRGIRSWLALSWATDGAVFAGGGALYSLSWLGGRWSAAGGTGPGYYERHQGRDLGCHLEFCSFAEVSRNFANRHRVMLRLMHISNGGIEERNPGNELLLLGYAIPLP